MFDIVQPVWSDQVYEMPERNTLSRILDGNAKSMPRRICVR